MNDSTKILLTIYLEGVLSQVKEDTIIVYQQSEKCDAKNPFKDLDKRAKKIVKSGTVHHLQRKTSVAVRKLSISEEAYNHWMNTIPDFWPMSKSASWNALPDKEKVRLHCARIASPNTFEFEIIGD